MIPLILQLQMMFSPVPWWVLTRGGKDSCEGVFDQKDGHHSPQRQNCSEGHWHVKKKSRKRDEKPRSSYVKQLSKSENTNHDEDLSFIESQGILPSSNRDFCIHMPKETTISAISIKRHGKSTSINCFNLI